VAEMTSSVVGVVRAIYRYPVKSMRGESLDESSVEWPGIPGDRSYAFVQSENHSTFPYLTGRELPELLLYTPVLTDPSRPYYSPVMVTTFVALSIEADGDRKRGARDEPSAACAESGRRTVVTMPRSDGYPMSGRTAVLARPPSRWLPRSVT